MKYIVASDVLLLGRIPVLEYVQYNWALLLHGATARANCVSHAARSECAHRLATLHDEVVYVCQLFGIARDQIFPAVKDMCSLPLVEGGLGLLECSSRKSHSVLGELGRCAAHDLQRHPLLLIKVFRGIGEATTHLAAEHHQRGTTTFSSKFSVHAVLSTTYHPQSCLTTVRRTDQHCVDGHETMAARQFRISNQHFARDPSCCHTADARCTLRHSESPSAQHHPRGTPTSGGESNRVNRHTGKRVMTNEVGEVVAASAPRHTNITP